MLSFYKEKHEKANNGPGRNDDDNKKEEKKDKNTLSKEDKTVGYNLSALRVRVKFKDKKNGHGHRYEFGPWYRRWGIFVIAVSMVEHMLKNY